MEDLAQKLTDWIKARVVGARSEGVVFGLSGGVDSAVVGALCRRAFPDSCLGLVMPCHSVASDVDDARLAARELGIPTEIVELDGVLDAFLRVLPQIDGDSHAKKLAVANIKPRLRMTTLYYFANLRGYLVVGTGNRSEAAMGYCTKYGDAGVDILPLGNLLKSQVRDLARHLGVPERIIAKPPSAGLWEGQTDEEEMGLAYEELDCYLATGEASDEIRRRVDSQSRATAHKLTPPPIPDF